MTQPGQTALKKITLKEALKQWEQKYPNKKLAEMTTVKVNGWLPPIEKMDGSTSLLVKCEFFSISTNFLERVSNLNSLKNLKILSIGRNYIKSLAGIEVCSDTLEELWASYNQIEKPSRGALACKKLKVLYLAHNWVREWSEISRLSELPLLEDLVIKGCPLEERFPSPGDPKLRDAAWQKAVGRNIKHLKKVDGWNIIRDEAE